MKKHFLLVLTILIVSTLFIGCSFAPVGNPRDYEDIEDNYSGEPYPLSSGNAYHAKAMMGNNPLNGSSEFYIFEAEADVHCQFAIKIYNGDSRYSVSIDNEKVTNPENGFNVPEGSELKIFVKTDLYVVSGDSTSYAEFYLYVD